MPGGVLEGQLKVVDAGHLHILRGLLCTFFLVFNVSCCSDLRFVGLLSGYVTSVRWIICIGFFFICIAGARNITFILNGYYRYPKC